MTIEQQIFHQKQEQRFCMNQAAKYRGLPGSWRSERMMYTMIAWEHRAVARRLARKLSQA